MKTTASILATLTVQLTGIRPLIMANPQTVQLSNKFAMESRRLTGLIKAARKKGDEDKLMELEKLQARNDWEASAYFDAKKKQFYLPDTVIQAAIRSGATAAKKGRDIDRAIIMNDALSYIDGVPKRGSLDEYFNKGEGEFVFDGPAKVPPKTGALIWKVRCIMPTGWRIKFSIDYDSDLIAEAALVQSLNTAGALCGVGGWRPRFGRFLVEVL